MEVTSESTVFDPRAAAPRTLFRRIEGTRAVVVGDVILDRYVEGDARRVSPEAPIPVVSVHAARDRVGGAANVAANLLALGVAPTLVATRGDDAEGSALVDALARVGLGTGGLVACPERPTTTKTRVVAASQQIVRFDREDPRPLSAEQEALAFDRAAEALSSADALVLSDYAKGVLSPSLCARLIDRARAAGIPIVVDPKGLEFRKYRGASVLTPNRSELAAVTRLHPTTHAEIARHAAALREELLVDELVATLGAEGLVAVSAEGALHIPAIAREVADVTGAGDTLVAGLTAGLVAGWDRLNRLRLANWAASVAVGRVGTCAVSAADVLRAIEGSSTGDAPLLSWDEAAEQRARWRRAGERVVFTNGCFDLLHAGHTSLLAEARGQGDRLVVGLNSDSSVRRLKGVARPVVPELDRAAVLASLRSVDAVVLFDDDTPLRLIERLLPDVLVKGADYAGRSIVGAAEVEAAGGRVHLAPLLAGRSTTALVAMAGVRTGRS
jgi:D-beta-D-heptose 7-phosphate kinase/D-beta-D-heptose 1-phosphate adenosyltransferase